MTKKRGISEVSIVFFLFLYVAHAGIEMHSAAFILQDKPKHEYIVNNDS